MTLYIAIMLAVAPCSISPRDCSHGCFEVNPASSSGSYFGGTWSSLGSYFGGTCTNGTPSAEIYFWRDNSALAEQELQGGALVFKCVFSKASLLCFKFLREQESKKLKTTERPVELRGK